MAGELRPILCVDFDGCLHSYTSGWQGAAIVTDLPVPGAIRWLERAAEVWDVHIYSSRSKDPEARGAMRQWLLINAHIVFEDEQRASALIDQVTFSHEKPAANMTIDDRCTRFEGDWSDPALDPQALLEFRPWNKRSMTEQMQHASDHAAR